ncbi:MULTISPECIES: hypothetical protein [unclassified Erwinia]|uniref:hypothetical protein n=1 Tax=unclassified Erwinia TaxID=2622719 RepID=UPI00130405FD|nr:MULTISPECIES: hypothetical protein [unclassified Erwinia]
MNVYKCGNAFFVYWSAFAIGGVFSTFLSVVGWLCFMIYSPAHGVKLMGFLLTICGG